MQARAHHPSGPRPRRWLAGVLGLTFGLSAITVGAAVAAPAAVPAAAPQAAPAAAAPAPPDGVIANLWEWNWRSIAKECTQVLGPKGYAGVQVAPPQDSLKRTALGNGSDTVLHPWWEVYQPVRYVLSSRMGSEAEFRTMVSTCRSAGVKVYVDAVINHMTGQGSTSYGGVAYERYAYEGLFGTTGTYSPNNFHKNTGQCPSSTGGIENFNDVTQVHNCELVGLADLRTETGYVRTQLVRYLNKLIGYGVSGFRVDAGKHVPQADLIAIRDRLQTTLDGERPYWVLEVGPGSPGAISPTAYLGAGDLLGFDYQKQIHDAFKSYTTPATGSIASLRVFGEDAGLLPSKRSLVFIHNHDTERNSNDTVNYKDGKTNIIAHQFMLAYPYGRPQVYASFTFGTDTAQSPPSDAAGLITDTDCSNGAWTCVDRDTGVANMVGFYNYVGKARLRNWYDDGQNLVAFSRGAKGWIAINNGTTNVTRSFQTGLPRGVYCDISHGTFADGACSGPRVQVGANGRATATVRAKEAVAFTKADLVSS